MNEKRTQQRHGARLMLHSAYVGGGVFLTGLGLVLAFTGLDIFVILGLVGIISGLIMISVGVKTQAELSKDYDDPEADPRSPIRQVLDDNLSPDEIRYKKQRTTRRAKYGAPKTRYGGMFQVLWSIVYFPLVVGSCVADMNRMTTADSLGAWPTFGIAVAGLAFYFYAIKRIDK